MIPDFFMNGTEMAHLWNADPNATRALLDLSRDTTAVGRARLHYFRFLELEPQHAQASAIRVWLKENPQ